MDRVLDEVGGPLLVILRGVDRRDVGGHHTRSCAPSQKPGCGRVDVELLVGVGVVPAVVGDPADRARPRRRSSR